MKNNTQKKIRTLTIQRDVRYGMNYIFKEIPTLRLAGLWLKKAGFEPGRKVQVEVKPKKLVIKTIK